MCFGKGEKKMENINTVPFKWFALAVVFFVLLTIISRKSKIADEKFDERQTVGRAQSYKLAFFTLIIYSVVYACLDSADIKWCQTPVGLLVGVFLSVTVFAVTAIRRDALVGIRGSAKSTVILWCIVIFVQLVCFALDCAEGKLFEDGVLAMPFVSLVNAVCFVVILIVFLVHNAKEEQPPEEEE